MDVSVISTSFSMPANRSQLPLGDKFGYGPISEDMTLPLATEEGETEEMLSLLVCPVHQGAL
jgi:hypothetical protein